MTMGMVSMTAMTKSTSHGKSSKYFTPKAMAYGNNLDNRSVMMK